MRILVLFIFCISMVDALEIDLESFEQEAKNDTTNIKARLILAREYIKQENFDKAKVTLDEVLALEATHPKATQLMKEVQTHQGVITKTITPKNKNSEIFSRATMLESIYKETNSFEDFKNYYYEVEGLGYKSKAFSKLEQFPSKIEPNPL